MNFKDATDGLFDRISHDVLAGTLGISVSSIRQARLPETAKSYRQPPTGWQFAVIRLAEQQIMKQRALIESVRKEIAKKNE
jgi:hypothetical protein